MNLRRFTIRRGNAKRMYFRLRGQGRVPQQLSPGSIVTFTMWQDGFANVINASPCVILDDGTPANYGRGYFDFTALLSASLATGVYEGKLDALIGGTEPLTFPDADTASDPDKKLLITVTDV